MRQLLNPYLILAKAYVQCCDDASAGDVILLGAMNWVMGWKYRHPSERSSVDPVIRSIEAHEEYLKAHP